MQRRDFLWKVPALAVVATAVTVKGHSGDMRELKPVRYVFCFPDASPETLRMIKAWLIRDGFQDPIVCGGVEAKGFTIYRID